MTPSDHALVPAWILVQLHVFVPPNQWVYLLCFAEVDILAAHSACIDLALCCHENFRGHFIHELVQLAV